MTNFMFINILTKMIEKLVKWDYRYVYLCCQHATGVSTICLPV